MAGFEPAPQGLEGPQATVTPHSRLVRPTGIEPVPPRWQRGMHASTPRPNVDRCRSPAHRDPSVFKDPALASAAARTARLATARLRARSDRSRRGAHEFTSGAPKASKPDLRALEARMLPLHHAAVAASRLDRFQRQNLPVTWRGSSSAREAKTKKAFQGIALEGLVLNECRAFRALYPPYRAR